MNLSLPTLLGSSTGPSGVDAVDDGSLEAMELLTADAQGWPHLAWLSPGEVLVLDDHRLALCLWPQSTTSQNLRSAGQALLQVVVEGEVHKLRLRAEALDDVVVGDRTFVGFVAEAVEARRDAVSYADVLAGPTYRLHEPEEVVARWHDQLEALARLVRPSGGTT